MRRGEIYWAELAPRSGSEQGGRRPVIVVSHDGFNMTPGWHSVIVVPMSTSARQARRGPTAVEIAPSGTGLHRAGIAVCHQVTTLDRTKLAKRIGMLSPALLSSVEEGLKAALDLDG
jgi:mRNA interferase MazF